MYQTGVATVKSIWERRGEIERARVKKNRELMGEYDR